MKTTCSNTPATACIEACIPGGEGRFPDLANVARPRWRDAWRALLRPALRVHHYRNVHREMFYDAICDWEQRKWR